MNKSIEVNSSQSHYQCNVGQDIFTEEVHRILDRAQSSNCFILIDENVERLHGDLISQSFDEADLETYMMTVPQGEASKSVSFWNSCVNFLLENGVRRNSPVFVIGGGVTGDVGGFAAATALRGVPLIHVPTTILSMVDSSVGGKTGVNHSVGKNLIGAFYQPEAVIADISFLKTLPRNEWTNGLSEILKYGAIRQSTIFDQAEIFLSEDIRQIDEQKLIDLISESIQIKADIVQEDEFEGGIRAYLNFGHTFAHALEKSCDYKKISHGEAVYLGMLAAIELSRNLGAQITADPILKYRSLYRYRVSKEELSLNDLMDHMKFDKKRTNEHIRFVLLKEWQHPFLEEVQSAKAIRQAWSYALDNL
ncbi:3-dehydroquinate synthase [Rhodohalobacter halophilus]|uniref:3-dehydroquinate synthase n=1 Tax=Rhodohalobacter halophilus TaxID=1812810 RepID=UPI00083F68B0|nr:3-dehydroquinate synthase [Rhodohalobacter halophilus]